MLLWLLILGCAGGDSDEGDTTSPAETEGELPVLTYNVHGLPPGITGDDTWGRMELIAPRLAGIPVVGLQEDWDLQGHEPLLAHADQAFQEWFDTSIDEKYYGAGLTALIDVPVVEYSEHHYETCAGILDGASDCLSSKGFQIIRVALGDGTLDVYNTHHEAGSGADDVVAREAQVELVIAEMNSYSAGRAVLFMGDTNLSDDDPEDYPLVERYLDEAGLTEGCESVDCPEPGQIDRFLFRSGDDLALTALSWKNLVEYQDEAGVPLSDHPALTMSFRWSTEPR